MSGTLSMYEILSGSTFPTPLNTCATCGLSFRHFTFPNSVKCALCGQLDWCGVLEFVSGAVGNTMDFVCLDCTQEGQE